MPDEGEQNTDDTGTGGAGATTTTASTETEGDENTFAPITSQAEFDKRIQARIARERAKFSDYDDVKSKAAELDKIREGEKTELQREREAREVAEKRAETAELAALRSKVASRPGKNVPASALTAATEAELIAQADELLAWRGESQQDDSAGKKKPTGARGLKSGTTGTDTPDRDPKAAAAEALRRLRSGG